MSEAIALNVDFLEDELPEQKYSLIYLDIPYNTGRNFGQYEDSFDEDSYKKLLSSLFETIITHSNNTTIAIQCDWHSTHLVRLFGDGALGRRNYKNEIIWNYNSGGASKTGLSKKHDTIHVWQLGKATYNEIREPYPNKYGGKVADKLHPDGRVIQDVWNDIPTMSTTSKERSGYPTQKPTRLLDRIIKLYTNENDWILDFVCGSGTTAVSAIQNNRNVVIADKNPNAIEIARERIDNAQKP